MTSPCQYFPSCGGCKYLDLNQDDYQELKSKALKSTLSSIYGGEINFHWTKPPSRRKVALHIDANNKIGFFKAGSKEIVPIETCYVASEKISAIIENLQIFIKSIPTKTINKIQLIEFDDGLDILLFLNKEFDFRCEGLATAFARKNRVNISTSFKKHIAILYMSSANNLRLENGIELTLNSNVFIQASKSGLASIVQIIRKFIKSNYSRPVSLADLYAGFGVYSFAVNDLAGNIELFEGSQGMIDVSRANIASNNCATTKANHRDLFNFPMSREELKKIDLAVINPPRNGASSQIKEITESKLKDLIYVSCNPKTFARDFTMLEKAGFKITNIDAIDQFYLTDHFEIVVAIQR